MGINYSNLYFKSNTVPIELIVEYKKNELRDLNVEI